MKFSTPSVFAAALLASTASAVPLFPRDGFLGSRATNSSAAAYCKALILVQLLVDLSEGRFYSYY
jgi:hypothetical protein